MRKQREVPRFRWRNKSMASGFFVSGMKWWNSGGWQPQQNHYEELKNQGFHIILIFMTHDLLFSMVFLDLDPQKSGVFCFGFKNHPKPLGLRTLDPQGRTPKGSAADAGESRSWLGGAGLWGPSDGMWVVPPFFIFLSFFSVFLGFATFFCFASDYSYYFYVIINSWP